jgi:HSP90 family molecular chaperone
MSKLRSVITKRILKHLREESEKDPEAYSKWFHEFQLMIKEGLL